MRRRLGARRVRGDQGATALEFALVLPVALLFIASIVVFGLHMTYGAMADHASRVGLKKAVVRTSAGYPSDSAVRDTLSSTLSFLGRPEVTLTPGDRGSLRQGDEVAIRVTYSVPGIEPIADIVPVASVREALLQLATVTRSAKGRAE